MKYILLCSIFVSFYKENKIENWFPIHYNNYIYRDINGCEYRDHFVLENGKTFLLHEIKCTATVERQEFIYTKNKIYQKREGEKLLYFKEPYNNQSYKRDKDTFIYIESMNSNIETPTGKYENLVKVRTIEHNFKDTTYHYIKPGIGIIAWTTKTKLLNYLYKIE
ncbi:MAG: hypothetical protein K0S33_1591 [Bacteroidetes bacterium]|jgi:hypothetical protein|nr:hypothetical protein [Bacteroidota bacterium]